MKLRVGEHGMDAVAYSGNHEAVIPPWLDLIENLHPLLT
jgi:hypothetical protein